MTIEPEATESQQQLIGLIARISGAPTPEPSRRDFWIDALYVGTLPSWSWSPPDDPDEIVVAVWFSPDGRLAVDVSTRLMPLTVKFPERPGRRLNWFLGWALRRHGVIW